MLPLLPEIIAIIIRDCETDIARKMFLSCCKSMRSLACLHTFDDVVDSRHLERCPHRHSNVMIKLTDQETYTVPASVTRVTITEDAIATVDLRLCTQLQYLSVHCYVNKMTLLNVPDCVECLYLFNGCFMNLPRLGSREAEVVMYSPHTGLNEIARCYLPSGIKKIGSINSCGMCCIMPLPFHKTHSAIRWTDGDSWEQIIARQKTGMPL